MNILNRINNVQQFIITKNDNLIFSSEYDNLNFIIIDNIRYRIESSADAIFQVSNDDILVKLLNGKTSIIHLFSGIVFTKSFNTIYATDNYIIFSKGGLFDQIFGVYNLKKEKELFTSEEFIGKDIFSKRILSGVNKVVCTDINHGQKLWEVPLDVYGSYIINSKERPIDIDKFIGLHNNVIYVKAGTVLILGFDIESGEEVYKVEYKDDFLVLDNPQLDKERGVLFSIGPRHYIEFNLSDQSYQFYDISASVSKHSVEAYHLGSWEKNLIYFWEGSSNNRFGIFDRDPKEVVWSSAIDEVQEKFPAIRSVKHGGNKLFVHDHNYTLHIFERKVE